VSTRSTTSTRNATRIQGGAFFAPLKLQSSGAFPATPAAGFPALHIAYTYGHDQTADGLSVVHPPGVRGPEEGTLLKEARMVLRTLPFDDLDVLGVEELGKSISGSRMDTNTLGRTARLRRSEPERPRISGLGPERYSGFRGSGYGVGLAGFTVRVAESLDLHSM
jgi:hypothetical protein